MNILVISKISIPAKDRTLPTWEHLRAKGHNIWVEHPGSAAVPFAPDAMISMGVTVMPETWLALERFPGVPLMSYNWDVYSWVWEPGQGGKVQAKHASRPGEYDYVRYGELLRRSREVWVPSHCTGLRTTEWYGINNWHVVLSACPWWDGPEVRDDGYALCCLREIPDPWWGKFEQACSELGIPYRMPKHEKTYEEYQDLVAGCRFLCAPLWELSTGGLSLMEGYRLGKPVLINDSPWNGGRDYFQQRATYFPHGDYENFKVMLSWMHNNAHLLAWPDQRQWIEANFSDARMGDDMVRRIETCRVS